jgi:hypothetical protein
MKPGWQSTEFWIALVGQALALLALTGTINVGDKDRIETALANAVTAVFTILSSAAVVVRYIKSRSELKSQALATPEPPRTPLLPLIVAALLFWPASAQAAPPSAPTCLMCRQRTDPAMLALLQQLAQNQQTIIALLQQRTPPPNAAPAQPLIIMVPGGPQQAIPLGQAPRQEIPLGGLPRQEIPLGGAPQQNIPLGPPPQQAVPLGPAPRQVIPLTPTPGEARPAPSAMQRYLSRS